MTKTSPATELSVGDVLAIVARCSFGRLDQQPQAIQMELMDTSPFSLVAVDPSFVGPNELSKRLIVLDGDQSSISVIDLYTSEDPEVMDPEIRVRLGAVEACG